MAQTSTASKWVNDILSGLAAASGVGYVATAYTISRWLTRPSPASPALPSESPEFSWETVACTTADGVKLAGWIAAPTQPRGTIVCFHGLRQNRAQALGRIRFLLHAGWRCVAFDHRAHGESEGKHTSFGWHEARDVEAITEVVATRWPDSPKVALGLSMGAAAVCFAAEATAPYSAFILESVYHDLASAFRQRVGCGYPAWFARFSRGVVWVTERRLGMTIQEATPAEYVHHLAPRPVLLLTGGDDPHAPPEEVSRVFERCRDPREFHVIPGAVHNDLDRAGGKRYEELVLGFLNRNVAT